MNTIKKTIPVITTSLLLLSGLLATPSIAQQTENQEPQKVTLESLLAQTLEATKETKALFDKEQAENGGIDNSSTPNIAFAPVIDISYQEVSSNTNEYLGATVRWGGQVIKSTRLNDSTLRLTVLSSKLSNEGRPLNDNQATHKGGHFIVDLAFTQEFDFQGHYLTFFGDVSSDLTATNGNRSTQIPVIQVYEFVDWNVVDSNASQYVDNQPRNSYYIARSRTRNSSFGSFSYNAYQPRYLQSGFSRHRSNFNNQRYSNSFNRHKFRNKRNLSIKKYKRY